MQDSKAQNLSDLLRHLEDLLTHVPTTKPGHTAARVGWVYIVECKGLYKIGYTSNLRSRLVSIQTATPFPVHLVHAMPSLHERKLERALHVIFEDSCVRGEWYNLSIREIAKIKSLSAQEILDIAKEISEAAKREEAKNQPQMAFDFGEENK